MQTPSPWAIVARRWTWVPSSRANASVSASHSSGTSRPHGRPGSDAGTAAHRGCCPGRLRSGWSRRRRRRRGPRPGLRALARGRLLDHRAVARLELGDALAGERGNGFAAAVLLEELHRAGGEVVVALVEGVPAGIGHREQPGRPAATAGGAGPGLDLSMRPSASRASRWRRTAVAVSWTRAKHRRGGGAVLQDQAGDPVAGEGLVAAGPSERTATAVSSVVPAIPATPVCPNSAPAQTPAELLCTGRRDTQTSMITGEI